MLVERCERSLAFVVSYDNVSSKRSNAQGTETGFVTESIAAQVYGIVHMKFVHKYTHSESVYVYAVVKQRKDEHQTTRN